jgi:hypothetical protein
MDKATRHCGAAASAILDPPGNDAGLPFTVPALEFPALVAAAAPMPVHDLRPTGMSEALADPDIIDHVEADLVAEIEAGAPLIEAPVREYRVPGLYARETTLPAGSKLTSMIHLTEHLFTISAGKVAVISENEGTVIYTAPFTGVTKPHTRRLLCPIETTIWTTYHLAGDDETTEQIANRILDKRKNPLLPPDHPLIEQWRREIKNLPST